MITRYYLSYPFTIIAVCIFGLYFTPKNFLERVMGKNYKIGMVLLAPYFIVTGVLAAVVNPLYNYTFGTFVFGELPPSIFFSGRINSYLRGDDEAKKAIASEYAQLINEADPGHFDI